MGASSAMQCLLDLARSFFVHLSSLEPPFDTGHTTCDRMQYTARQSLKRSGKRQPTMHRQFKTEKNAATKKTVVLNRSSFSPKPAENSVLKM